GGYPYRADDHAGDEVRHHRQHDDQGYPGGGDDVAELVGQRDFAVQREEVEELELAPLRHDLVADDEVEPLAVAVAQVEVEPLVDEAMAAPRVDERGRHDRGAGRVELAGAGVLADHLDRHAAAVGLGQDRLDGGRGGGVGGVGDEAVELLGRRRAVPGGRGD